MTLMCISDYIAVGKSDGDGMFCWPFLRWRVSNGQVMFGCAGVGDSGHTVIRSMCSEKDREVFIESKGKNKLFNLFIHSFFFMWFVELSPILSSMVASDL